MDPMDAMDPMGPMDPLDPMDPMCTMGPMDPIDPMNPMDSMDPKDPMDPMSPMDSKDPMDPMNPMAPMDPIDPIDPMDPIQWTEKPSQVLKTTALCGPGSSPNEYQHIHRVPPHPPILILQSTMCSLAKLFPGNGRIRRDDLELLCTCQILSVTHALVFPGGDIVFNIEIGGRGGETSRAPKTRSSFYLRNTFRQQSPAASFFSEKMKRNGTQWSRRLASTRVDHIF